MNTLLSFILIFLFHTWVFTQEVHLEIGAQGALFSEKGDTILFYRSAEKDLNGTYARANYIHPLYSLDGAILTEDFPADHLHHRGIFWAWHQLYVGEKRIGDGWETRNFSWKVKSVEKVSGKKKPKSIRVQVDWLSPLWMDQNGIPKPMVSEETTITVYPRKKDRRAIDIEISMLALEPDTRIGGSEDEKGYGGFSPRIRLPEDVRFRGAAGPVELRVTPVKARGWMDISGSIGKEGALVGLAILSHPDNPGYPNPWILRAKGSMQNAVWPHPGAQAVPLSNSEPTVLRYRLILHDGLDEKKLGKLHAEFGKQ